MQHATIVQHFAFLFSNPTEVEYSWSPEQIGYALGVIFFITAVVGGVIALLRRKATGGVGR